MYPEKKGESRMARVLAGTPPHVVDQYAADTQRALAWLQAHYDAFRGQWVAVQLRHPDVIAHAPTLTQLWQVASSAVLQDCLIHYVSTVANDSQAQGMEWDA
jgi:predicted metal-dependent HD superfamily phosphohydrolase